MSLLTPAATLHERLGGLVARGNALSLVGGIPALATSAALLDWRLDKPMSWFDDVFRSGA